MATPTSVVGLNAQESDGRAPKLPFPVSRFPFPTPDSG
jgi:hypothetical protein